MDKEMLVDKKAILISVKTQDKNDIDTLSSIEELKELTALCKIEVVDYMIQRMEKVNFRHYIGKGKVEELKVKIEELGINVVVADCELTYVQIKNLQEAIGIKVIDRTEIILDVFYQGAKTKDTQLLFEIAKLRYRISRGNEDKKELIKEKLNYLEEKLKEKDKHHKLLKENRKKSKIQVVAIVGYSNAGKSSILNVLASDNVYIADKLFATMDPTTRLVKLPSKGEVLFTDTVGFIRNLPKNLLNLFHISIDEIKNADLVLHVMDISSKDFDKQRKVVNDTLDFLGIDRSKVIEVFNKIDLVKDRSIEENKKTISVSGKYGTNIDELLTEVENFFRSNLEKIELIIPYNDVGALSIIYKYGENIIQEYKENGIHVKGYIRKEKYYYIAKYRIII